MYNLTDVFVSSLFYSKYFVRDCVTCESAYSNFKFMKVKMELVVREAIKALYCY